MLSAPNMRGLQWVVAAFCVVFVAACAEGGSDESSSGGQAGGGGGQTQSVDMPATTADAARFLTITTFGPTEDDINDVMRIGYSAWVKDQFGKPLRTLSNQLPIVGPDERIEGDDASALFWDPAVNGEDQLRQRVAFALSQLLVVSINDGGVDRYGVSLAAYMDSLQRGAFGNYRTLLQEITYSPTMGLYLTYIGNRRADMDTGAVPDENYAREIMQLFTIGLVELNRDGTVRTDGSGRAIETYDNMDVTELAKVFTGLWWADLPFGRQQGQVTPLIEERPMTMNQSDHSPASKSFLGMTIPAATPGDESITMALDHLFGHSNTAPFVSEQLIQRLVTSNPSPAYVERVVTAFENGRATLPNGEEIGSGNRGDMRAVVAAVITDIEAIGPDSLNNPAHGKVREPVIRFIHWARAFDAQNITIEGDSQLRDTSRPDRLNQQPFASPSVFNFYRPGYVAPQTNTADAGLVAPELQITDASSIIGYYNFMDRYIRRSPTASTNNFAPDYFDELALATDPEALVERMNLLLMAGQMRDTTRARMLEAMEALPISQNNPDRDRRERVQAAVLMATSAPEFLVQR